MKKKNSRKISAFAMFNVKIWCSYALHIYEHALERNLAYVLCVQAIAFGRGDRGFIVINNEPDVSLSERLQTGLPESRYCDVISCDNNLPPCGNTGGKCRSEIYVDVAGFAQFDVPAGEDPILAIHVWDKSRLPSAPPPAALDLHNAGWGMVDFCIRGIYWARIDNQYMGSLHFLT